MRGRRPRRKSFFYVRAVAKSGADTSRPLLMERALVARRTHRFPYTNTPRAHALAFTLFEVEIIDGHRLNKARGQLSTNPYVVLTLNGDPFARSTTCWGTTHPLWLAETFRVRLPSPPPGTWPLTVQGYFREMRYRKKEKKMVTLRKKNVSIPPLFSSRTIARNLSALAESLHRRSTSPSSFICSPWFPFSRTYHASSETDVRPR